MGYFTRSEWVDGFSRLEVDSLEKLRAKLPAFRNIFDSPSDSKELYMFAFVFAKENDSKNLPLELAKGMWKLVCPPEHFPLIPSFLAFLDEMAPVKVVNKDQWRSFWEFSVTVSYDLTGYDETSACKCYPAIIALAVCFNPTKPKVCITGPLLFDEYVAWRRK
ncbi:Cullin binding-domain-containing protein [Fimicolochytrium jonesii]|uniref:Cullin binding-domain-containing protein n=1 Tax=Fimicolochytrium jonesii TaxID=1396493 RepID=UPI0022FE6A26|nr:Cullin binding-domain-containing protein [Fimicolochytrium jonesii]KAI8821424.1 Cullin binding-domain-containing protein [Fimicolochytrium jonesii]